MLMVTRMWRRLTASGSYVLPPIIALIIGLHVGQAYERSRLTSTLGIIDQNGSGTVLRSPAQEVNLAKLWSAWQILMEHYVDPAALSKQKLVDGAVRGLVAAVKDPYTMYFSPEENKEFQNDLSGHLEGIGAELVERDGLIVVVSPLRSSPAERAGLLPEDVILQVNEEDVTDKPLMDVILKIRGPKGTSVHLTIGREKIRQPIELTIIRDDIKIPSTEYETRKTTAGSVGIIRINQFGTQTPAEVRQILESGGAADDKGLIIDLRNNGGGYLDGAVALASMFIAEGNVVSVRGNTELPDSFAVSGFPILSATIPIVVLINKGSASASEILAGALQDHHRAMIVGLQSFGKGTVQEVVELPDGSSIKVTTAHWLTPNGKDLGKEGVTPDVVVDLTEEDAKAKKDPQLEKAIDVLTKELN